MDSRIEVLKTLTETKPNKDINGKAIACVSTRKSRILCSELSGSGDPHVLNFELYNHPRKS